MAYKLELDYCIVRLKFHYRTNLQRNFKNK